MPQAWILSRATAPLKGGWYLSLGHFGIGVALTPCPVVKVTILVGRGQSGVQKDSEVGGKS